MTSEIRDGMKSDSIWDGQLQMYSNAKHIVYKTIYGYLGIPDSIN